MKKRESSFELLRIISMCMIIAMHYMTKGMQIPKLSVDNSLKNIIFWVIYALCMVSVNVYVLISGYFMVDSKWRLKKVVKLWLQVFFYSVLVPIILIICGAIKFGDIDFGLKQQIFLPISYEHYWFATAYVMMYLISPILCSAIDNMTKENLSKTIIGLLVVFGGFKSINPYLIPWDKYGCDVLWFICLFLVAGYIRKYGISFFDSARKGFIVYFAFSLLTFMIAFIMSILVRSTGKLEYYMDMTYSYNYVTLFIASIGLFYAFIYISKKNINKDAKKSGEIINWLAKYTFGVYLLHENVLIREKWQILLGVNRIDSIIVQILHMVLCIAIVFILGTVVDFVRDFIFSKIIKD